MLQFALYKWTQSTGKNKNRPITRISKSTNNQLTAYSLILDRSRKEVFCRVDGVDVAKETETERN